MSVASCAQNERNNANKIIEELFEMSHCSEMKEKAAG